ncbi:MAG: hypothetical protein ACERKZ_13245 [Lachnotalea sp.]
MDKNQKYEVTNKLVETNGNRKTATRKTGCGACKGHISCDY